MQPVSAASLSLFFLFLFLFSASTTHAHNITRILAKHPEFSTFNHYLTITHLAGEINRRQTITVCAVDNAGMSSLLSKGLSLYAIKNVLSLHVFADYFGSKKLHQITKGSTTTATMFQATGEAPGTTGFVNITDLKGGKVRFAPEDNTQSNAVYVKSILEMPYNISVIQISDILSSPEAEAPTSAPDLNLTSLMQRQGCKAFYDLLSTSGAIGTFLATADGGVTVFCPSDAAVAAFMPKYNNLTAEDKTSVLLYHGIPVYNSLGMLRSSNGLKNTLAAEGAKKKYDFTVQNDGDDVKLKTKVVTATITGTVVDEEPVALYKIDKVLLPRELFKATADEEADAPAPSSTKHKGKKKKETTDDEDAEAPGPDSSDYSDEDAADSTANGAVKFGGLGLVIAVVMGWLAFA